jgi:hypothetical protein
MLAQKASEDQNNQIRSQYLGWAVLSAKLDDFFLNNKQKMWA